MKFSQFNSILPYGDKYVLYNSFHQKVMFIDPFLNDILTAAIREGVDNLKSIHPTFYDYLQDQEYLVGDSIDEVDNVKNLRNEVDYNWSDFYLTINPTMNCNFKCWYCYETHVRNSRLNDDVIGRVNKLIHTTLNKKDLKTFTLSFFGGEPLLYFERDVIPIIDPYLSGCKANDIPVSITFTTNGYLINEKFVEYFKKNNIRCSLQITLDGYKEMHNIVRFVSASKGSYDEIIANIRLLISNGFFVRLRVNYTEKNIADTHKIADEFSDIPNNIKDKYLIMDFHRVWQDDKPDDVHLVLEKNVSAIKNKGIKTSTKNSPNNVRRSCYGDKLNSAVINYNGDVFKCTARDFTTAKRAGYINEDGTIFWEDNYLERRMNAKFKNKPCLTCRIMPLCNGGCSQHAFEHLDGEEYCVYFGDEKIKDEVVRTKIEEVLEKA